MSEGGEGVEGVGSSIAGSAAVIVCRAGARLGDVGITPDRLPPSDSPRPGMPTNDGLPTLPPLSRALHAGFSAIRSSSGGQSQRW